MSRPKRLAEAVSLLEDAQSMIEELRDEMDNWRDGLSGTNLENSELYERLEEASGNLDDATNDISSAISTAEGVEFPRAFGG